METALAPLLQTRASSSMRPTPEAPLQSGWPAFDALRLVEPGRVLLADVGSETASRLLCRLLADAVAKRGEAIVMDGGNWLDVYRLGECAEEAGHPRLETLRGVRVARGFTAYQLQSLIEDAMPRAVAEGGAAVGFVLVSCFPEMYLDEDLAPQEAAVLARRALDVCRRVAKESDVPVVVSNSTLPPGARHRIRKALDEGVDARVGLFPARGGALRIVTGERSLLAPSPRARQRVLGDFTAAEGAVGSFMRHAPDARVRYLSKRAGELKHRQKQQNGVVA